MKSFAVAATGVMLLLVTGASADIRPGEVARLHAAAQVVQDIRGTVPPNLSKALTSNVFGTDDPRPSDPAGDESRA